MGVGACFVLLCAHYNGTTVVLTLSTQQLHNYHKQDRLFHMTMHLPVALAAVSTTVQTILREQFGRASIIIPNSVDAVHRFFPGPRVHVEPTMRVSWDGGRPVHALCKTPPKSVLLVGNPGLPLKGGMPGWVQLQPTMCKGCMHM